MRSLSSLIAHKNWGQGNEKWKIRGIEETIATVEEEYKGLVAVLLE